jgi:signal peptidase I
MRKQLQRHGRLLGNLAVLAFLGVWFLTLAPTAIGGPAAYIEVSGHSMDGTYRTGDLIVTRQQDTYARGDIVAFEVDGGGQVIHRITGGNGQSGYTLQGDNNPDPDPWHPTDADVVGKAWVRFADKAWMMHLPREPWFAGLTAGVLTLVVLGWDARPRRRSAAHEVDDATDPSNDEVPETVPVARLVPHQRTDSTPAPRPTPLRRPRQGDPVQQPGDSPVAPTRQGEP